MKYVYLAVGFLMFGLGAIGVILPVLPTTPFLLVASFCFAKGSKRFHNWFLATKLYQNHLDDFVKTRSMTLKSKVTLLAFASSMLLLAFFMVDIVHARIAILVVMAVKYYYFIFRIKTIKPQVEKVN